MSFGGLFDNLIIGLPLYFWIIAIGFTAFVILCIFAVYTWWNLGPVWGWYTALRKNEAMALKRNKNRRAIMVPITTVAHIFHDEENPEMWHQTSLESAQYLGGVPMVDVCDWHDWIDDEIINQAIVESAEQWNAAHPEDKVYDYFTYQTKLTNGDFNAYFKGEVKVPAFFKVELSKVERYMPKERSASTFGGFITYYANKMASQTAKSVWGLLLPIGAICGMVLITSIVAYLIIKLAG